jgi:hypothetical protein
MTAVLLYGENFVMPDYVTLVLGYVLSHRVVLASHHQIGRTKNIKFQDILLETKAMLHKYF